MMRIQRQGDGWWIVDVPAVSTSGGNSTACGPYATRAQALEDKQGLERFFRECPACDRPAPRALQPHPAGADLDNHLPGRALTPASFPHRRRKRFKSALGQRLLPGFEPDDPPDAARPHAGSAAGS